MMTDLTSWSPRALPGNKVLEGRRVRLEPLVWSAHRQGLFSALGGAAHAAIWRYMAIGPFASADIMERTVSEAITEGGWRTLVIRRLSDGKIVGMASYMRNRPDHGSTEVGSIAYSPLLQNSAGGTEAMALMASHVFDDLRYRRYEWKCDAANAASRSAAERLGFTFEGIFRQDLVMKGRNRDTAWFSIIDSEWPAHRAALTSWLDPKNFDEDGKQLRRLQDFRKTA